MTVGSFDYALGSEHLSEIVCNAEHFEDIFKLTAFKLVNCLDSPACEYLICMMMVMVMLMFVVVASASAICIMMMMFVVVMMVLVVMVMFMMLVNELFL